MEVINQLYQLLVHFVDIFLNLDHHLGLLIQDYGIWTYVILFAVIFCETSLVVTPFLPGDSLLFAAGAAAAVTVQNVSESVAFQLNPHVLFISLTIAAIIGDAVNYSIGHYFGKKITAFKFRGKLLIKEAHIKKTQAFYEKHGGKTIVLARFIPIIRTFAPFVAGLGKMNYRTFFAYNVFGGIFWVSSFIYLGYAFGNLPIIKKNFSLVIVAIIILSILPGVIEIIKAKMAQKKSIAANS